MRSPHTVGLVLTGGGARGAYQAGVLRALAECCPRGTPSPFQVLTGVSAGAINATFLAAHASDFDAATSELWQLWANLSTADVFSTNPLLLGRTGIRLIAELSLGRLPRGQRTNHLLDTTPLWHLLEKHLDEQKIADGLAAGAYRALAVTATNYDTGAAVTFFNGAPELRPWERSTRIAARERVRAVHVLASCALPLFFPPVRIGHNYYGDGCVRLSAPLSASIHLGSERVFVIGVRHPRKLLSSQPASERLNGPSEPTLANIGGVLMNAVFLESLETDLERAHRINDTLSRMSEADRAAQDLRILPVLTVLPSQDLGSLATDLIDDFPWSVRHLLRGVGASRDTGWDMLSYLAFEHRYTQQLLDLGYADGMAERERFAEFLGG